MVYTLLYGIPTLIVFLAYIAFRKKHFVSHSSGVKFNRNTHLRSQDYIDILEVEETANTFVAESNVPISKITDKVYLKKLELHKVDEFIPKDLFFKMDKDLLEVYLNPNEDYSLNQFQYSILNAPVSIEDIEYNGFDLYNPKNKTSKVVFKFQWEELYNEHIKFKDTGTLNTLKAKERAMVLYSTYELKHFSEPSFKKLLTHYYISSSLETVFIYFLELKIGWKLNNFPTNKNDDTLDSQDIFNFLSSKITEKYEKVYLGFKEDTHDHWKNWKDETNSLFLTYNILSKEIKLTIYKT